jgi:dihydrofolate reductase
VAKLIYTAIASLDGYVADEDGKFDWLAPDDEVHRFVNDLERPIGTYLYGRRLYEVMSVWETIEDDDPAMRDYAQIWRSADKVVFSRTLESVATPRTSLERDFDPEAIERMKSEARNDLSVGGSELAGQALRAELVDECHFFLSPVMVGGGNSAFPDGLRQRLELLGEQRFGNGVVHLHYRMA